VASIFCEKRIVFRNVPKTLRGVSKPGRSPEISSATRKLAAKGKLSALAQERPEYFHIGATNTARFLFASLPVPGLTRIGFSKTAGNGTYEPNQVRSPPWMV